MNNTYVILEHWEKRTLENLVSEYMRDGWQVSGGLSVIRSSNGDAYYYQAMVKV